MRNTWPKIFVFALAILGSMLIAACSSAGPAAEDATAAETGAAAAAGDVVQRPEQYVLQNVPAPSIEITSNAVGARNRLNKYFTCEGADVSPALSWSGAPLETKSYALILEDPISEEIREEGGGMWTHWILYSIPPHVTSLEEELPQIETLDIGAKHGLNDYQTSFYSGPCPQPTIFVPRQCGGDGTGSGCGTDNISSAKVRPYYFRVYALDKEIDLAPGATRNELLQEIEGHVLAAGELAPEYRSARRVLATEPDQKFSAQGR